MCRSTNGWESIKKNMKNTEVKNYQTMAEKQGTNGWYLGVCRSSAARKRHKQ